MQSYLLRMVDMFNVRHQVTLKVACVFDHPFTIEDILSSVPEDARHMQSTLEQLCDSGILERASEDGSLYAFVSGLLRRVLSGTMLKSQRESVLVKQGSTANLLMAE